MSRTRRAIFGFITDTGGQVAITIATLVTTPFILRHTSEGQYGFWLTALSILSYLGLMDLGLGVALTRAVSTHAQSGDADRLNQIISTAFFVFCLAGLLFIAAGWYFAAFIPGWFGIPAEDAAIVVHAFRIVVVASALALPVSIFSGVLCGFQQMGVDNLLRVSTTLGALGLSIAWLAAGWGLSALAWSTLTCVVVNGALAAWWAWRSFPALRLSLARANRVDLRALLGFGGYFQLGRVANTIALNTDSVVISAAVGASAVPTYNFSSRMATLFSVTLASKLPMAVFPAMSEMYAARQWDRLQGAFIKMTAYSVRFAIVGTVICALCNRDFVSLWVGESLFGGTALSLVFCYWILQDTIYRGTTSIVYAAGRLRPWALASLLEGAFTIVLSTLLVRPLGLLGVALGKAIAKTTTTAWFVPLLVCRSIQLPIRRYLAGGIVGPALRSLPGVGIAILVAAALPSSPGWIKMGCIAATAVLANSLAFEGVVLLSVRQRGWGALRDYARVR